MAISVKDIQEKEFAAVSENGYDMEQVDDFLDELAEQWGAMLRDNLALGEQVKQLKEQAQEQSAELAAKTAALNDATDLIQGMVDAEVENAMSQITD